METVRLQTPSTPQPSPALQEAAGILARWRDAARLTLADAAKQIRISYTTLSAFEGARKMPRKRDVSKIADAIRCPRLVELHARHRAWHQPDPAEQLRRRVDDLQRAASAIGKLLADVPHNEMSAFEHRAWWAAHAARDHLIAIR
jgi:transcriptional regulator with XRE-family HTH domain